MDRRNLCSILGTSARRGSKEVSSDRSQSGMEADSESQGSYDSKKLTLERGLDVGDMEDDKNDNQAQVGMKNYISATVNEVFMDVIYVQGVVGRERVCVCCSCRLSC